MLPLNFRHLADRMFFAGVGKQNNRERNDYNAQANERSHNALAQLSVSGRVRKAKAQTGRAESFDHYYEQEAEQEL